MLQTMDDIITGKFSAGYKVTGMSVLQENKIPPSGGGEGINQEFGINIYTLLYKK